MDTEVTGRTFGEELATAASLLRGPDVLHLPDAVRVAAADLLDAASTARGTPDPYALRLARAVSLRIDFNFRTGSDKCLGVGVWTSGDDSIYPPFWTMYGKRPDYDVRDTILRAAAHVGKGMP